MVLTNIPGAIGVPSYVRTLPFHPFYDALPNNTGGIELISTAHRSLIDAVSYEGPLTAVSYGSGRRVRRRRGA